MGQGLERGDGGCEVIPAQNLHPFKGPHGNYKSRNGVKVFSGASTAAPFLSQNFNAVEKFSIVIQHLATVFKLHLRTLAIYYEPNGRTIAFNSNKSLYFNLRYFCSLHLNQVDGACYSLVHDICSRIGSQSCQCTQQGTWSLYREHRHALFTRFFSAFISNSLKSYCNHPAR